LLTPPSDEKQVTLYCVMADPPSLAGGEYETLTLPTPGVTPVTVGAPGALAAPAGTAPMAAPAIARPHTHAFQP
jgi:hypothetical protein